MTSLAIIPARGGSKRIPKKNIRMFAGRPIIAYSIEAALRSCLFDKVMVSTDSQEVADVAREYGAEVPFMRSNVSADDHAPLFAVISEVIECYAKESFEPGIICCLLPTAPFVTPRLLKNSYNKVSSEGFDSCFTVQQFSFPIFRALRKTEKGNLEMYWPEYRNSRSQDLPEACHDAGQLYVAKTSSILAEGTFYCRNSTGIRLSSLEAHDIDTVEDWEFAEYLFNYNRDHE